MKNRLSRLFTAVAATAAAAALLAAGGCAPKNWSYDEDGPFDPFEGANRLSYKLHKGLDFIALRPVGVIYSKFPSPIRTGFSNVVSNLSEPAGAINHAVRRDGDAMINSTARFVFNSILGVGGLIDIASVMDIPHKEANFSKTLRGYGIKNTPYLFIPVLGPTTPVDSVGSRMDSYAKPQYYIPSRAGRNTFFSTYSAHTRANLLDTTDWVAENALDDYLFVRDAYEQKMRHNLPTKFWGDNLPTKLWGK